MNPRQRANDVLSLAYLVALCLLVFVASLFTP